MIVLEIRDILETSPLWLQFHSQKEEELTKGQISKEGGDHSHDGRRQKYAALTKQCASNWPLLVLL